MQVSLNDCFFYEKETSTMIETLFMHLKEIKKSQMGFAISSSQAIFGFYLFIILSFYFLFCFFNLFILKNFIYYCFYFFVYYF
jgi:hypothetical protein